jgi:hypothetical protein
LAWVWEHLAGGVIHGTNATGPQSEVTYDPATTPPWTIKLRWLFLETETDAEVADFIDALGP